MSLEYAILGFLSEEDRSGYDLKTRCFDNEARHFWSADQAQVYRTLERLEKNRLVASRLVRQSDKPNRKVYRLTPGGRDALAAWLARPQPSPTRRDPLLLQLRFAEALSDDELRSLLANARAANQARLEELRSQLSGHALGSAAPPRRAEFTRMTIEAALASVRSTIDWIDDCAETLHAEEAARETGSAPQRRLFGLPSEPGGDAR